MAELQAVFSSHKPSHVSEAKYPASKPPIHTKPAPTFKAPAWSDVVDSETSKRPTPPPFEYDSKGLGSMDDPDSPSWSVMSAGALSVASNVSEDEASPAASLAGSDVEELTAQQLDYLETATQHTASTARSISAWEYDY